MTEPSVKEELEKVKEMMHHLLVVANKHDILGKIKNEINEYFQKTHQLIQVHQIAKSAIEEIEKKVKTANLNKTKPEGELKSSHEGHTKTNLKAVTKAALTNSKSRETVRLESIKEEDHDDYEEICANPSQSIIEKVKSSSLSNANPISQEDLTTNQNHLEIKRSKDEKSNQILIEKPQEALDLSKYTDKNSKQTTKTAKIKEEKQNPKTTQASIKKAKQPTKAKDHTNKAAESNTKEDDKQKNGLKTTLIKTSPQTCQVKGSHENNAKKQIKTSANNKNLEPITPEILKNDETNAKESEIKEHDQSAAKKTTVTQAPEVNAQDQKQEIKADTNAQNSKSKKKKRTKNNKQSTKNINDKKAAKEENIDELIASFAKQDQTKKRN